MSQQESGGFWTVRVCLVTERNGSIDDINIGGDASIGPHIWVVEEHKDAFIAEMEKCYGNYHRVREIVVEGREWCEGEAPTLEDELRIFKEFLAAPQMIKISG